MKPKTLSIESVLVVLEQLARSGKLQYVPEGKKIRFTQRGLAGIWSPLTVVAFEVAQLPVKLAPDERPEVQNEFMTTSDQICRIMDAEDGQNGYHGYDHALRAQFERIAALCTQM